MTPYTFDEEYLRRLKAGDSITGAHFVEHFKPLLDVVWRQTGLSRLQADDLTQEVFSRFFKDLHAGKIRQAERIAAYIRAISDTVRLEFYRKIATGGSWKGSTPEQTTTQLTEGLLLEELRRLDESNVGVVNTSDDFVISFASGLSAEQVKGALYALAEYYRACGGVGFETEFELEEALLPELSHV
jgi:DNA-directed RNA polymerase specialized sigma24 family protein